MRLKLLTSLAGGFSAVVAGLLTGGGDRNNTLTATGNNSQANSALINATITTVTVGGANTGVRLPADMAPGDEIIIYNKGTGAAINVYPNTGGNINNAGANVAVTLANNTGCWVACVAPNDYILK